MRHTLTVLLVMIVLPLTAGCGPPCGRSVGTSVTGSVDGEEVALCHAYFGVDVYQTSRTSQNSLVLLLAESDSACEQAALEERFSPPGSVQVASLDLDTTIQRSDYFFAYRMAGHDFLLGAGDVAFRIVVPENLPRRGDSGPPYPNVGGRVEGSLQIQIAMPEDGGEVLGSLAGSFEARHCEQMDSMAVE